MNCFIGNPLILGCNKINNRYNFAFECSESDAYICIFRRNEKKPQSRIMLDSSFKTGNVFACSIDGVNLDDCFYCYEAGGQRFIDPYAKAVSDCSTFGVKHARDLHISPVALTDYDWEGDKPLRHKYGDSIFYKLNVRGFTRSRTSKVKAKGTFAGIMEKLDYIKQLGVTAIELMPAYEFDDVQRFSQLGEHTLLARYAVDKNHIFDGGHLLNARSPVNFWGYTRGFYFAPKASYSSIASEGADYTTEFKDMVKLFHQNDIEVIMEFFFERERTHLIMDCIRYWVTEYHIDGAHVYCDDKSVHALASDPVLADTKIITVRWNGGAGSGHMASYNDDFQNVCRRYLKGDENMIGAFIGMQKNNPEHCANINYVTSNNGFTLYDLVSYDRKHNEMNGENNRDGENFNYSWNCGEEGATRKKRICDLRVKQMKNALIFLLLSSGTPLILAGDEFCNSQGGNNNPYCLDNETSWINWKETCRAQEILLWTRQLIMFRKQYGVLHMDRPLSVSNKMNCGYPELSYHGSNAWYADMENYNRHVGIMMVNEHVEHKSDRLIYLAYNMHWERHDLALPKVEGKKGWKIVMCSGTDREEAVLNQDSRTVTVAPRSIAILVAVYVKTGKK